MRSNFVLRTCDTHFDNPVNAKEEVIAEVAYVFFRGGAYVSEQPDLVVTEAFELLPLSTYTAEPFF